jgi:Tfp pilus assembly protein PilX
MMRSYLVTRSIDHNINPKYRSQTGFALPLALGLGLVMIIVAASIIGRSQNDRDMTSVQRETNRALSISEAGIIRVQSFLDRHKFLATKNLNQWSSTLDNLPPSQASCRSIDVTVAKQQASLFKNNTWIALDGSDLNKGRYRVIDYRYQNGVGKLTVTSQIDAYNTTHNSSNSTLTVDIPIGSESARIAPPALWSNTFNLSTNQKITGQIQGVDCPQLPIVDADGIAGVDVNNIALISGLPSGQIVADPFTQIPPAKVAPNTAISISAITSSIELPRPNPSDLPDANGEYHYMVDIDPSGYSIKLHDLDRIQLNIAANRKINLYLKGNIDLAGGQTVNVDPTHPNLRIYGSTQTVRLIVKDTASITAFIHAPLADAQSISSSPANPNKKLAGALWVKSWNSATSPNQIPIIQAGTWADFGISKSEQPSQVSPISYWQRVGN